MEQRLLECPTHLQLRHLILISNESKPRLRRDGLRTETWCGAGEDAENDDDDDEAACIGEGRPIASSECTAEGVDTPAPMRE